MVFSLYGDGGDLEHNCHFSTSGDANIQLTNCFIFITIHVFNVPNRMRFHLSILFYRLKDPTN